MSSTFVLLTIFPDSCNLTVESEAVMAKLKAHGQELLRIERQYKLHEGTSTETLYRETRSY